MEHTASEIDFLSQRKRALKGDAFSQFNTGYCYAKGDAVEKDYSKALYWYKRAVNNPKSDRKIRGIILSSIAAIYDEQDNPEALSYYMQSARLGYKLSQLEMGQTRHFGAGFKNDLNKAVVWYKRALRNGAKDAAYYLGLIYNDADFKDHNARKALHYFKISAQDDCKYSWLELGLIAEDKNGIPATEKQTANCYHQSVKLGHVKAIGFLGWYYISIRNYQQAFHWLSDGTKKGDSWSQCGLANMYRQGYWVEKDLSKAIEYCKEPALAGYGQAQDDLAQIYIIHQDYKNAYRWLSRAARKGRVEAQYNLGILYMQGLSIDHNPKESTRWFKEAGKQGHAKAQFNTGLAYLNGYGIRQCKQSAKDWFYKAYCNGIVIPDDALIEFGVETPDQLSSGSVLFSKMDTVNQETLH